ncbi:hypothetical protein [Dawidia soli]|uniref:Lipoprotein n=1 Tax=Dawidia soli TaxID=2782352 RepID=A0AAP2GJY8_9BACT|nr:hypothetical protein [Dawidia soli]MBT1689886.1 hypothetical protein [Dawidia soli]
MYLPSFWQTAVLSVFSLLYFSACSDEKTQREQYEDATSGLTFSTYKTTSSTIVGPAVTLYNSQKEDSLPSIDPAYVHLLLGYGWTVSGKHAMAFAEADLTQEEGDTTAQYLARSLRSIAMYEQGWDSLAHEEAAHSKKLLRPDSQAAYEVATFYVIMALAQAYDKDFAQAKFYFAGFANETGIHWPYKLTDAIDDFQHNRLQEGLIKMKALSQDPDVPPVLQQALAEQLTVIEEKAGDVNSSLFWPRLISAVVLEQLKKSSNSEIGKVVQMAERLRGKIV